MRIATAINTFAALMIMCNSLGASGKPVVAVLDSQFENIPKILNTYRIPFTKLKLRDLENLEKLREYSVIFFPCGIGKPVHTSITILSYGPSIQSVSLKKGFCEVDRETVCKNIKTYIHKGGRAYFSGYSFVFPQRTFKCFTFYDEFPYQGLSGMVRMELHGEVVHFSRSDSLTVAFPHSGWVAVNTFADADILAMGAYKTPRGARKGPLIGLFKRGDGEFFYTSYHSDDPSNPVIRFLVLRSVFRNLVMGLEKKVYKWDQKMGTSVVDTILPGEFVKMYNVDLAQGSNTIYFTGSTGFFQIDVFDEKNQIVASKHVWKTSYLQNIEMQYSTSCTVKVYPCAAENYTPFALVVGQGSRIIPYRRYFVVGLLLISGVVLLYIVSRIVSPRKYSGRAR